MSCHLRSTLSLVRRFDSSLALRALIDPALALGVRIEAQADGIPM